MDRKHVDEAIAAEGVVAAGAKFGVAAILYTYRCTIACQHCCFGCGASRPDVKMSAEKVIRYLRDLHELGRVIHIAGGEAMMYWPQLAEAMVEARRQGVQPYFIESNCSFAVSDEVVRERLEFLKLQGLCGMLFSADPYHQAFVPPENFLRARRIAVEIFGQRNVWANHGPDRQVHDFAAVARDGAFCGYALANPPRLVGTAQRQFAAAFPQYPLAELPPGQGWRYPHAGADCGLEFDAGKIWEVHIDPYDNIQTNCGVILGKADRVSVGECMRRGPQNANWVANLLATRGPVALAEAARDRHGFAPPARAASKCDLCYQTRSFLRRFHPDILGPAEVYG